MSTEYGEGTKLPQLTISNIISDCTRARMSGGWLYSMLLKLKQYSTKPIFDADWILMATRIQLSQVATFYYSLPNNILAGDIIVIY